MNPLVLPHRGNVSLVDSSDIVAYELGLTEYHRADRVTIICYGFFSWHGPIPMAVYAARGIVDCG